MSESIEPGMPRRRLEEIRECRPSTNGDAVPLVRPTDYDLRKPESYLPAFVAAVLVLVGMTLFILFLVVLHLVLA